MQSIAKYDETNPKSAIGTPEQVRHHLRTLEQIGVDQVLFMHQGGRMPHEWNCESLELFAREVMPEFADRDEQRQKEKAVRLEPVVAAAVGRKQKRAELRDDEIPLVFPYGQASWIPTNETAAVGGVTDETSSALGLVAPPGRGCIKSWLDRASKMSSTGGKQGSPRSVALDHTYVEEYPGT
jgi:hypothetical protein